MNLHAWFPLAHSLLVRGGRLAFQLGLISNAAFGFHRDHWEHSLLDVILHSDATFVVES
jgi:hypothetical protein